MNIDTRPAGRSMIRVRRLQQGRFYELIVPPNTGVIWMTATEARQAIATLQSALDEDAQT
jgi:hypothetical protein